MLRTPTGYYFKSYQICKEYKIGDIKFGNQVLRKEWD